MLRKILQPFYTAYVVLIFVATLFAVLPFYLVLSLPNTAASRKMIWRLTWLWSWLWLRLTGMWLRRFGTLPQGDPFVIIANHVSYLDPIVIYDVLPFYFRPLAKHELKNVPLFGFIYAQIALLVDRSSVQSRAASMRAMQDALHNDCSVFMYPEGTFNESADAMQAFYDGAFRLAIEAQVSILPIVFPDTKARWHYSAWWKMWPGKNRAYILEPISVQGLSLEDVPVLKEKVRAIMGDELMRQMEKSGK